MTRKLLLIYTCLILSGVICYAQQKKTSPIKGEIIFSSFSVIPDSSFFVKSLKESQKRLVSHLVKKLDYNDSNIDTAEILSLMGNHIFPSISPTKKTIIIYIKTVLLKVIKQMTVKNPENFQLSTRKNPSLHI